MEKYRIFKNAIETFQRGGADAPILYSTTEMNEKGFKSLLGRNIKMRPMAPIIMAFMLIIVITSALTIIFPGYSGTAGFTGFVPVWVIFFAYRTTLITVGADGLSFYCIDSKFGSKYVVYDSFSLPYDKITDIKIKSGRYNTSFTFEFSNDDKKYKIKNYVTNKINKMDEQAQNIKYLKESLEKK
jgi:hypothetical protein